MSTITRKPFTIDPVAQRVLSRGSAAALFVAASLVLLTVLAVLGRAPYDDEIANFYLVQNKDIGAIVRLANSIDVHPPGSYVINALLFGLLGSWDSVKIAGGCLNAFALALFLWLAYGKLPGRQRVALTFLLATASTMIMWGASVRWYAYFNPLFTVALAVLLFADISRVARTIVLGVSAVLLFHIGYAAFCAVPVLAVAHFGRGLRDWSRRDFAILGVTAILALALCAPQLWIFARVHAPHQATQVGGLIPALLQTTTTIVLGNAVFPVAPLPIVYGLIVLLAVGYWLLARRRFPLEWWVLAALATGIVGMIATGIGIKPRNSVYLLPLVAFVVTSALAVLPKVPYLIASLPVIAFQSLGFWNVATHQNTIKGSYNSNFEAALEQIEQWNQRCGHIVVLNHDPVLSYLLDRAGIPESSPYEELPKPTVDVGNGECLAIVKTFHGVIPPTALARMYGAAHLDELRRIDVRDIGPDPYFKIKGRLLHDSVPATYLHLEEFQANTPLSLPDWSTFVTREGRAR